MIKTKLIIKSLAGGGAERIILNFLKKFNEMHGEENIELLVLLKEGELLNNDLPKNIKYCYKPLGKIHRFFCLIKLFLNRKSIALNFLEDENETTVVSFLEGWGDMILHSYSSPNILKKVSWLHCDYTLYHKFNPVRLLFKRYASKSDVINCVSKSVKAAIDSEFSDKDIRVVYNFIDFDDIDTKVTGSLNCFSNDDINVLSIGRLVPQKNLFFLLNAFQLVVQSLSNTKLHILGDGDLRKELEAKTKELNLSSKVIFHGFNSNPYPMVRDCDIVALSSLSEGLPTVVIEAAYLKTKLVSTKCGSDELLSLFDYPDTIDFSVELFAEALIDEISSKRVDLEKGLFEQNFSFNSMLEGMKS
jgi:glycosyltransferase involved in cell wall biosynthesis